MALTATIVEKANFGSRRAQIVDFAFVDPTVAGEAFTPETVGFHVIDAVLPQVYETSSPDGAWSVSHDPANELLFLTKNGTAVSATTEDATVRAIVVGI